MQHIGGTDFTPGSLVNFFVATSNGRVNAGLLTPTANTPTSALAGPGYVQARDPSFTSSGNGPSRAFMPK